MRTNRHLKTGKNADDVENGISAMTNPALEAVVRTKGIYIGAPACFELELAMQHLASAFGRFNSYVVGSALKRADWRFGDHMPAFAVPARAGSYIGRTGQRKSQHLARPCQPAPERSVVIISRKNRYAVRIQGCQYRTVFQRHCFQLVLLSLRA